MSDDPAMEVAQSANDFARKADPVDDPAEWPEKIARIEAEIVEAQRELVRWEPAIRKIRHIEHEIGMLRLELARLQAAQAGSAP